jgi:hypothetical protein
MRKGKLLIIIGAIAGLLVCGVVSAGAVLVDFDDLPLSQNIDGQHLEVFPNGVTITSADASTFVGDRWTSYNHSVTNDGFLVVNPLVFTFDVPRGFVQFTGGDAGGDLDQFNVKAYDNGGNLLFSVDSPVFGGNPLDLDLYMVDQYTIIFDNALHGTGFIKTLEVTSIGPEAGIEIDDLIFCQPVPIPPSAILLGSGLLGLVGLRRFRKA